MTTTTTTTSSEAVTSDSDHGQLRRARKLLAVKRVAVAFRIATRSRKKAALVRTTIFYTVNQHADQYVAKLRTAGLVEVDTVDLLTDQEVSVSKWGVMRQVRLFIMLGVAALLVIGCVMFASRTRARGGSSRSRLFKPSKRARALGRAQSYPISL
jgi:hypothetical protein